MLDASKNIYTYMCTQTGVFKEKKKKKKKTKKKKNIHFNICDKRIVLIIFGETRNIYHLIHFCLGCTGHKASENAHITCVIRLDEHISYIAIQSGVLVLFGFLFFYRHRL